jgi:hypothetical protein|tara:strand:+ start:1270 stop:1374 length:105 start_codon:yes stop_codon:yes gene_type:complete
VIEMKEVEKFDTIIGDILGIIIIFLIGYACFVMF